MALIKCPECGKQISEKAPNCPNCGFVLSDEHEQKECENKMPGKGMFMGCLDVGCMSIVWIVIVIIAFIFILGGISSC